MAASQDIAIHFLFLLLSASASDYYITEKNLTNETLKAVKDLESKYPDYVPRKCRKGNDHFVISHAPMTHYKIYVMAWPSRFK
jgi:hypothetical protein